MSWDDRRRIFEPGARYRALSGAPSNAAANGEIWVFEKLVYSRYDGLFVYSFLNEADGTARVWALRDDEPEASWREIFEPTDE